MKYIIIILTIFIITCIIGLTIYFIKKQNSSPTLTDWKNFDAQSLLPSNLKNHINFAGTKNNFDISKIDPDTKQKYFSYLKLTDCQKYPSKCVISTPWGTPQGNLNSMNWWNPLTKSSFDWDVSSGLFDGNGYGRPSDCAKVLFNIMSLTAKSPIVSSDKYKNNDTIAQHYARKFLRGDLTPSLSDNILTVNWSAGLFSYNCGIMGLKCCYDDKNPTSGQDVRQYCTSTDLPCEKGKPLWGHAGSTYGSKVYGIFIPKGSHKFLPEDCAIMAAVNTQIDICSNFPGSWSSCTAGFLAKLPPDNSITDSNTFRQKIKETAKSWCTLVSNNYNYPGATITLGFYMQNFYGKEIQTWSTINTDCNFTNCPDNCPCPNLQTEINKNIGKTIEPSYLLGSFTKPVTAALVVNGLYNLYKKKKINKDFFEWFKTVSFGDLGKLTSNFNQGAHQIFTDTMTAGIGSVGYPGAPITLPMSSFLYDCDPPACKGIYCPCSRQGCDKNVNQWFKNTTDSTKAGVYSWNNTICSNTNIKPSKNYSEWFNKLTPYQLLMMRGGIPDADTLGIDTVYQQRYRTHPFGPIEFLYEWNGFIRPPGAKCKDIPNKCSAGKPDNYAAEYSSSGYTLVGILLYLLSQ
jgi:hypothetical protein